jgi:hypothetical protein
MIYSAVATLGFDRQMHNMSDHTLRLTFWTAAAIMLFAFLLSVYFSYVYADRYKEGASMATES